MFYIKKEFVVKNKFYKKLKKLTILYAEDDIGIRENISDTLKYYVDNIYEANDGEEAYQIYEDKFLNIILTDIHMPKIDGIELIKKIREKNSEIPILIITGYSNKDFLIENIPWNNIYYLEKPIEFESLFEVLRKIVFQTKK